MILHDEITHAGITPSSMCCCFLQLGFPVLRFLQELEQSGNNCYWCHVLKFISRLSICRVKSVSTIMQQLEFIIHRYLVSSSSNANETGARNKATQYILPGTN